MSVTELTTSAQNYLKAIWALKEWQDSTITPSALANYVGVRPSTVTDAIKKLVNDGLVNHLPYGDIELTTAGRAHALEMIRRHRLIETYLVKELNYSWDEVHAEAETLEHAVSDLMVERIATKLGNPTRDPHGDPIPSANGHIVVPAACPITLQDVDSEVVVERIADEDSELLQYLAEHEVAIGGKLKLQAGPRFSESLIAVNSAGEFVLGKTAMAAIWVSRSK